MPPRRSQRTLALRALPGFHGDIDALPMRTGVPMFLVSNANTPAGPMTTWSTLPRPSSCQSWMTFHRCDNASRAWPVRCSPTPPAPQC